MAKLTGGVAVHAPLGNKAGGGVEDGNPLGDFVAYVDPALAVHGDGRGPDKLAVIFAICAKDAEILAVEIADCDSHSPSIGL